MAHEKARDLDGCRRGPHGEPCAHVNGSATPMPLAGVRVLEIATFIAAPFCGSVLADFGAEVIKVEQPGEGDPLRRFGTPTDCGDTLVWLSEARNKKCVTLDLRSDEGATMFRSLVEKSDVVLENFRPGTLERWNLGFEDLQRVNPGIIMLRVSAYGQTGPASPWGSRRVQRLGTRREPSRPGGAGRPLADSWAHSAYCLRRAAANRRAPAFIDIGLYESIFRIRRDRSGLREVRTCARAWKPTRSTCR